MMGKMSALSAIIVSIFLRVDDVDIIERVAGGVLERGVPGVEV